MYTKKLRTSFYEKCHKRIYTKWNKTLCTIIKYKQNEIKNLHYEEIHQTLFNKRIITTLEKEVKFLKTEISSKNDIIDKFVNSTINKENKENVEGKTWRNENKT